MPDQLTLTQVSEILRKGRSVFIPGASGEPSGLLRHLEAEPGRSAGLDMLTTMIPGINRLAIDRLDPTARVTGVFSRPDFRTAQREGRYRALVVSYYGLVRQVRERLTFATCVAQVAPPDAAGRCSLGPTAEFVPTAISRSQAVIGVINPETPRVPGAPSIAYQDFAGVVEAGHPLAAYDLGAPDPTSVAIAGNVAGLIEDGAALQIGLGKVPDALLAALTDRRRLRLFSGLFTDGLLALDANGCLDPDFPPTACTLVGSAGFYRRLDGYDRVRVVGCEISHDVRQLSAIDGFTAINSALEVDLLGQVNAELVDGRAISGAGGGPDFARAARLAKGGRSIIALGATAQNGERSRIVPRLGPESVCSVARYDVDLIATELGVADLRGLSVHERAAAIIAVAAPQHRDALEESWRQIAKAL